MIYTELPPGTLFSNKVGTYFLVLGCKEHDKQGKQYEVYVISQKKIMDWYPAQQHIDIKLAE